MQIYVALAGNPNVGKSTVFNAWTGLHQHTGNWPGKTVEKKTGEVRRGGDTFAITDLPGAYSLSAHSPEEDVTDTYLTAKSLAERGEVTVVVCDGSTLERNLSLVLEILSRTNRVVVCVNLMDEAERRGISIDGAELAKLLGCPVVLCAARSGRGLDDLLAVVRETALSPVSDSVSVVPDISVRAKEIAATVVRHTGKNAPDTRDRRIDRVLTGKYTAFPCMLALLFLLFWLTIQGAGAISTQLDGALRSLLHILATHTGFLPSVLHAFLWDGVLDTLFTVIAVMLPPMAIFFPLFSLMEDAGLLPRAAFNTDRLFASCGACGKQCLTMMMGFGCNAVGVTGCRIIDSPRERKIAMLTNAFVPCNGRFPMILTLLTVLCRNPLQSAAAFVGCLVLSLVVTLLVSRFLSDTALRGEAAVFAMEMPPYRIPQCGKVIVRSILDRIVYVLGRAAAVAAPAGGILWILRNVTIADESLLCKLIRFLDPIGRAAGMDGVIFSAFLLSLPAAEIFYPLVVNGYMAIGTSFSGVGDWSAVTALCVLFFTMFHFPCATTLWTIRRESGSTRFMWHAALLPTVVGYALCVLIGLFG